MLKVIAVLMRKNPKMSKESFPKNVLIIPAPFVQNVPYK
jgi:hypothetical protein